MNEPPSTQKTAVKYNDTILQTMLKQSNRFNESVIGTVLVPVDNMIPHPSQRPLCDARVKSIKDQIYGSEC